jgi:D-xylose 1-dehydrogenase
MTNVAAFASYPSLRSRGVIVTGGATGIGASIVEHLAAQGGVAFLDIDTGSGERLGNRLTAAGLGVHFAACDLRDIEQLRAAIVAARERIGPITGLVNNAARDDRHKIESVTPEFWDERMAVNLRHQFFAAQAVIADMRAVQSGSIVNLGSVSWLVKAKHMPAYLTAKAAVAGLTRALARDLGADHVRVNCVLPGWVMTERQSSLWLTPEAEAELMRAQCLEERLMPPDIARMVLWLLADDSRLVTAQSFVVDAGWT